MTVCHDAQLLTELGVETEAGTLSADGTWLYSYSVNGLFRRHGRPLTPVWVIRHIPTGAVADRVRSLTTARLRTADGTADADVRMMAEREAEGFYGPELVARGWVKLQILDEEILPAGPVDSRCTCGGYLLRQAGEWMHVDTCEEEVHHPSLLGCPDAGITHRYCDQPVAAQCDHPQCIRGNDLNALPCETGHDHCCGCCTGAC